MIAKHNQILWNEVLGDPFSTALTPLMMSGDGITKTRLSRTPGTTDKVATEIRYDKQYVLAFITKKVLQKLLIKDKAEAIALISEVWDYYEKSWSGTEIDG
jgi:hypothetical protein